jgi:hypothetical protein
MSADLASDRPLVVGREKTVDGCRLRRRDFLRRSLEGPMRTLAISYRSQHFAGVIPRISRSDLCVETHCVPPGVVYILPHRFTTNRSQTLGGNRMATGLIGLGHYPIG